MTTRSYNLTLNDFTVKLKRLLHKAGTGNEGYIDIRSGDLHSLLGGYPGHNHRMPVCCQAMRNEMKIEDEIIQQPPKGNGANLVIRYKLPR